MSESQALPNDEEISWFWEEMEADVRATLSPEQRIAIEKAMAKSADESRPADLRLYLGKYFIRIIAGKERRNKKRLRQDLKKNPVFAKRNLPVAILFWTLWVFSVLYVLAFISTLVESFLFK
ncbi:hypothetical protein [Hyphococcus sp.]|uniref:hypothetical protein n=1 Tax=Hyphococcus sp. TaxID=2038636 RepID=UPI0035C6C60F